MTTYLIIAGWTLGLGILARLLRSVGIGFVAVTFVMFACVLPNVR